MKFLDRTREIRELEEEERLAPAATRASRSRGREHPEPPEDYRTAFERDRDRILHSKAFRRLKHKTQVFINPDGDHYVTRLTHTLQVTQVGRAMASALGLNETLTEAICLGHDVGHSPFGHTGEDALSPYLGGRWHHSAQSVRVLSVLEPLNPTWEVLDGVGAHSWRVEPPPATPEGRLVRFADRIAYLTHDTQDALRAGVLTESELPSQALTVLGGSARQWIDTMIRGVISESLAAGTVAMRPEVLEAMDGLRGYLFERVYLRPDAERQKERAVAIIRDLVDHLIDHPDRIPESYRHDAAEPVVQAIDYVAGMTDRFALRAHDRLFRPEGLD